jgi:chemotaxis signal transduction protein
MPPIDPTEDDAGFPDWLNSNDTPGEPDLSELLAAVSVPDAPAPPPPPPAPLPRPTGEPFLYGTVVALGTHAAASDVQIEHDIPTGLRVLATSPAVTVRRHGTLIWRFPRGQHGARIPLRIQAVRIDGGTHLPLAQGVFRVSCTNRFTSSVPLVRPEITAAFTGPSSINLGESATLTLKVRNTGACLLHSLMVRVQPSGGFEVLGPTEHDFADVPVRGEVTVAVPVVGRVVGPGGMRAEVRAQPEAATFAEMSGEVAVAKLEPGFVSPSRWLVKQPQTLTVITRNTGTAPARLVGVRVRIPEGWAVGGDAAYDPLSRELFTMVDEIAPGAAFEWPLTLTPLLPGSGTFELALDDTNAPGVAVLTAVAELDPAESNGILERLVQELGYAPGEALEPAIEAGSAALSQAGREHPHVVFSVADTDYAFPLGAVREIGRPPTATPLPNSPEWLIGVASIRGDIVSMVDMGAFLDEVPMQPGRDSRFLIVTTPGNEMTAGLLVDRVRGIRSIPPEQVRAPAAPVTARCASYMTGVAVLDRGSVVVLAADRLLPAPEFQPFGHS